MWSPFSMILVKDILVQDYGVNMAGIILTKQIIDEFQSHGEQEFPHECCGFILGNFTSDDQGEALEYIPASNTKEENRERRFLIDPMAYQKAEDKADEQGLSVISIVHSHPDHPDKPSEFDREHAWPGFSYIIIAVHAGRAVSFKSWQLSQDRSHFNEEYVTIKENK